jgi:hypothetical protein
MVDLFLRGGYQVVLPAVVEKKSVLDTSVLKLAPL